MFVGAMGADKGIPFMANEAGAKAYVRSLSLSLHEEFKSQGIHVTVLPPASIDTPVLEKFGFDPATMPMKPMAVDRCVNEALRALTQNRPVIIPGRVNRIMNAVIPAAMARRLMARMLAKTVATAASPPTAGVDERQAGGCPKQPQKRECTNDNNNRTVEQGISARSVRYAFQQAGLRRCRTFLVAVLHPT